MDNNQAILEAIRKNDMEMFLDLLHQPGIDLNVRDDDTDQTPLIRSIRQHRYAMAKHLIKAGCDINVTDSWERSPLEHAIIGKYYYVYSEEFDELELVSMLLYYGADANVTNWRGETPITRALKYCNKDVAEFLLNYYDDFFWKTGGGDTALRYATEMESPLVIGLVERGADVNCRGTDVLLYYTRHNRNAATFKFIWSRISHETLLNVNWDGYPILLHYLRHHHTYTSNSEYFECLYLMLKSPIAYLLIQECINYYDNNKFCSDGFVHDVLYMCDKRNVLPNDRLSLIYLFLGFGVEIKIEDLQCAYRRYGVNEEFKALLYSGNLNCYDFTEQIGCCINLKEDYHTKVFSSLSLEKRQDLISLISKSEFEYKHVLEALNKVPEVPSLFELSRNKAQKFVHENFEVTKLYQFYDAVNCLKLPQVMKDVILLEKTIYPDYFSEHKN